MDHADVASSYCTDMSPEPNEAVEVPDVPELSGKACYPGASNTGLR